MCSHPQLAFLLIQVFNEFTISKGLIVSFSVPTFHYKSKNYVTNWEHLKRGLHIYGFFQRISSFHISFEFFWYPGGQTGSSNFVPIMWKMGYGLNIPISGYNAFLNNIWDGIPEQRSKVVLRQSVFLHDPGGSWPTGEVIGS